MSVAVESRTRESEALARLALARYDISPQATLTLTNFSDNVIYRVDDAATGERFALRLHREGYHDRTQVKSELQWLDALRADRPVQVPPPVSAKNGERVVIVDSDDGARMITLNGWMDGAAPSTDGESLAPTFRILGATAAKLHRHSIGWDLPVGFCRPTWGSEECFGEHPVLGHWREALGLDPDSARLLQRAETAVRLRLGEFAVGPGQFGLIHADLRAANLRVDDSSHEDVVRVIDFDDCGKGWLMYDFGAAVSFVEHDPRLPEMLASWVEGYRTERPLEPLQESQLTTFVMLRRLVLLGWVARNAETATDALAQGEGFTAGACEVAERYLSGTLGL